jgi:hypothetical protein
MTSTLEMPGPSADEKRRQVVVIVIVAVAHAAAVDQRHVIQERAVSV